MDPGDHGERQLPRTLCGAAGRPLDETVAARADRRRDEKRLHSIYAMAQEMASSQEVQTETLQGVSKETVEKAQKLLHRLHKAAGHPPNRGLATNLIYQACIDAKRGEQLVLPVSVGTKPQPWQFVGIDVFELPSMSRRPRPDFCS